jgi:hypothetical protein
VSLAALALAALLAAGCAAGTNVSLPHQARDLEALLPAQVAGRSLAIWSMHGDRWLAMQADTELQARASQLRQADGFAVAISDLAYAVAERSNAQDDPPYAIHVMRRPPDSAPQAQALADLLFTGSLRFRAGFGLQTSTLQSREVGGKPVLVGTPEMLVQDEEQRGRPYLYEADGCVFAVVTDEEAWAADALSRLP